MTKFQPAESEKLEMVSPHTRHILNPTPSTKANMGVETVEMYFSYPTQSASKGAILVLTDVMGHRFTNLQL
jgi:hypothetical protein